MDGWMVDCLDGWIEGKTGSRINRWMDRKIDWSS